MPPDDDFIEGLTQEPDAGAAPEPTQSDPPAAANEGTSADAQPSEKEPAAPSKEEEREDLIAQVLAKHQPKTDNDEDPATPKSLASENAPDGKPAKAETPDAGKEGEKPTEPEKTIPENAKPEDWLSKEEMAALGPKARGRIESLWRENREHRTYAEAAEPYLEPLRSHAVSLADVEIMAGMSGALARGDYETFYNAIMPYVSLASQALGKSLPDDIQNQVDNGDMTPEVGAELSRSRFKAATQEAQRQAAEDRLQQQRDGFQQQQDDAARQDISSAVNQWEEAQKASDPDYARLRPLILDKMVAFVTQHGPPPSKEAALNLAAHAKNEVMKVMRPASPQPTRQSQVRPGVNGAAKAPARPAPKNAYEHVFAKLGL